MNIVKFSLKEIYRGDEKTWSINFEDNECNPLNLVGRTVYFTAKTDKSDSDDNAVLRKVFLLPSNTNSENGTFDFTLTSEDTEPILEGSYVCDFRISFTAEPEKIYSTIEGLIEIEQPVTNI